MTILPEEAWLISPTMYLFLLEQGNDYFSVTIDVANKKKPPQLTRYDDQEKWLSASCPFKNKPGALKLYNGNYRINWDFPDGNMRVVGKIIPVKTPA